MLGKLLRGILTALLAGAVSFWADITTKILFFDRATQEGQMFSLLGGMIRSTLHRNYGISFNLPLPGWVTLLITGLALGWAVAMLVERSRRGHIIPCLILGVFIGGVIGNVYDRLTFGYVRDWLLLFGRSAINLADLLIASGILAWLAFLPKKQRLTDEAS